LGVAFGRLKGEAEMNVIERVFSLSMPFPKNGTHLGSSPGQAFSGSCSRFGFERFERVRIGAISPPHQIIGMAGQIALAATFAPAYGANPFQIAHHPRVGVKQRGAMERLEALLQLVRRIRALGGDGVEIMARKPYVPSDVSDLVSAVLQLVETRTPGTQILPPRGKPAEHPGSSAADRYGHGRLLALRREPASKAARAH
jgi:hypothetical protein